MKACYRIAAVVCGLVMPIMTHGQQSPAAIVSAAEYEISGVVTDSVSGQKLSGINVRIAPAQNQEAVQTTKTGADGGFSFHHLARGKYSLDASGRGYPDQAFNQHENYSTAIVAGPELKSTDIAFRLHPEASIRGTVVDEENDPVENASVRLFTTVIEQGELRTRLAGMRSTDDLGHFSFTHLREGAYYVAVSGRPWYSSNPYQARVSHGFTEGREPNTTSEQVAEEQSANLDKAFPLTFYEGALSSAEATAMDLQPGQNVTTEITMRAVPAVHIRVPRKSSPTPAGGDGGGGEGFLSRRTSTTVPPQIQLFHTIFDDMLLPAEAMMVGSSDGFEVTGIAPGHYIMQVVNPGEDHRDGSYREIDLTGDVDLPTDAAPLTAVSGVVKFDGEHPPAGLAVVIASRQLSRGYGARTTGEGEFRFDDPIMPGRYQLSLGNARDWYIKSFTASGAKVSGRTLEISGSSAVRLMLEIGHGLARVEGVAVRDGQPAAGAMVLLVPQNAANSPGLVRRDQSDSDGTFTLYNIVPGQYTLLAIEDGWRLPWSNPKLLHRYLPQGRSIQIFPGAQAQSSVEVQPAR